MNSRTLISVALSLLLLTACTKRNYEINSPDNRLSVAVDSKSLSYILSYNSVQLTANTPIAMSLEGGTIWNGGTPQRIRTRQVRNTVHPVVGKNDEIREAYNELILIYNDYIVTFRAYDEGFAYRFTARGQENDSLVVVNEQAPFLFLSDPSVIFGETNNFTAWELSNNLYPSVSSIDSGKYAITPTVMSDSINAMTIVVAESDVHNYPGMYLQKRGDGLYGYWAKSPREIVMGSWGNFVTVVTQREDNIATVPGNESFPWRIIIPTTDDASLLNNELIYLLAEPCKLDDTSWIKPGKATWEWWHCAILPDAPFKSGQISTQLYKYYIDFAAENGLEYLLIDAGWNNLFRPTELNPNVDIHEILRYGDEKGVGVWLWMVASTLIHYPHQYLDSVSAWGATGVKIDFFDRDDDDVMRQYEELARACAERHLLVDFHGCSKPTGLQRTYPNILNFEAVRGQECAKWDTSTNPDYRMQFIFGRMLAGPMDYTPGSMRNCNPDTFTPRDPGLPSTLGTRCNEMAMYILLDDYFAMLCDSPDAYRHDSTILRYLQKVPVVWNETHPLSAKVGHHAIIAKRTGERWYVGGMCGYQGNTSSVSLDFLMPNKQYNLELYEDTDETRKDASIYQYRTMTVTADTTLQMTMQPGGGFMMVLTPIE